jgi:hypothetical protein
LLDHIYNKEVNVQFLTVSVHNRGWLADAIVVPPPYVPVGKGRPIEVKRWAEAEGRVGRYAGRKTTR